MQTTANAAPTAGFCRDCLADTGAGDVRCPSCGSPRLVRHPELFTMSIAHVDCDAFYAAVEKRDDPSLADKPLIIGGRHRGVVSTACYLARIKGVRSAMPMYQALKLCPNAVVKPPQMAKYAAVSRQIRMILGAATPLVEPISIDEAFLDLGGTERLHRTPPAKTLARLASTVEHEVGVTLSVGLSYNKYLAKVASDREKPRGFSVIGRAEATTFLAAQPVSILWGVGQATQRKLARDGIVKVGQLQRLSQADLVRRYGQIGGQIHRLARGEDARVVKPVRTSKSVSAERTFDQDIDDLALLERRLWPLCEEVAGRLKSSQLACRTVTLKLRTSAFRTVTRAHTLDTPDYHAETLYREGRRMLSDVADGTAFRLIGIAASGLGEQAATSGNLFGDGPGRKALQAEEAVDRVRAKFGKDAIGKGRGLRSQAPAKTGNKSP